MWVFKFSLNDENVLSVFVVITRNFGVEYFYPIKKSYKTSRINSKVRFVVCQVSNHK